MIVGTAGHVDHGKTSLVRALTGVDTDRLAIEKQRGITIELGFAYLPLPDGGVIGFVDVPGHERFVHTMLAGAGGIDFFLLLVAADDGVMPQTREHVSILDLLGVTRGLVVLSKADRVDAARLAAVSQESSELLSQTSLRADAVLPVSALSGVGMAELRAALAAAAAQTTRTQGGGFRLAVDRRFTLPGAGTVVTGTVLSGAVSVGDHVRVSPSGLEARVRSLHAQNRESAVAAAGQRCALGLAGDGVTIDAIHRGDMVLDPALHAPTTRIDAELRVLTSEAVPVSQWFPVRLHHASAELGAHVVPLGPPLAPGDIAPVQLVLERPIAACAGDRFVVRDTSARRTIGGGAFLDLRPPARKRRTPERLAQLAALRAPSLAERLRGLMETTGIVDLGAFARDHALLAAGRDRLRAEVHAATLPAGETIYVMLPEQRAALSSALRTVVEAFHAGHPDLQGPGRERLRLSMTPRLPAAVFLSVLQAERDAGAVVLEGAFVRLPGHEVRLAADDEALWHRAAPLLGGAARFRPPRVRDIATELAIPENRLRSVLKLCARLGRVDQIAHDHFFLRVTTREMVALACDAASVAGGEFSAAAFRDRMDNGRKVAIQILDFLDRHGVTLRRGDLRRINPQRRDLFDGGDANAADANVADANAGNGRESSLVGRPDFKSGWGSQAASGGFDSRSLPP